MKGIRSRVLLVAGGLLVGGYLILLLPSSSVSPPKDGEKAAFEWRQDEYWSNLEARYSEARSTAYAMLAPQLESSFVRVDSLLRELRGVYLSPDSPIFREIENEFFHLGVLVAAYPDKLTEYANAFAELRMLVKNQSILWDMNSKLARDCMYRILYGGRTAVEEAMHQAHPALIPELVVGSDETESRTPSAIVSDLCIHSGDILVSRGGAPTSALIARGNDYPGNFSHAALVHVDDSTNHVSIIEAHIECGVVISSVDDYLNDTKLRIMVLRMRPDMPEMLADPMIPHEAAEFAHGRAKDGHVAYDFTMDSDDHSRLFCSEVVSEAYAKVGIRLWKGMSHISSSGTRNWLSAFGVENFTTQEPSDLEYDPQLNVVAEWRDSETLTRDRVDNAVVDVMLEGADEGDPLEYDLYMLPIARFAKVCSVVMNQFGLVGPVPEGMSAVAALQNRWFTRKHKATVDKLNSLIQDFKSEKLYFPPYWEMVTLARQAYTR